MDRDRAIQSAARLSMSLEAMLAHDFGMVLTSAVALAVIEIEHGHHAGAAEMAHHRVMAYRGGMARRLRMAANEAGNHTLVTVGRAKSIAALETKLHDPYELAIGTWAQEHAAKRIVEIADTTRAQIADVLSDAVDDGDSNQTTGKRIADVLGGAAARDRADTIARTETHTATQYGAAAAAEAAGVDVVKEWGATEDGRTRPSHAAADGQVVELDDAFVVGGEELQFPGDPNGSAENIINCRCVALYRPRRDGE